MNKRILFILKKRSEYSGYASGVSTGLLNSARFVNEMLNHNPRMISKLVAVTDNNDIDREVTEFNPTHVIIEALWVVPAKFVELNRLHPEVKWVVRLHSEAPFLANEGMAMDWIYQYMNLPYVYLGINSARFLNDLKNVAWFGDQDRLLFMPNYYPTDDYKCTRPAGKPKMINIGCFGAIRPLKNHLAQALAAIKFANDINVSVAFHINVGRIEMKGMAVLSNLRALFDNNPNHSLVEHDWLEHDEFLALISVMDSCMQVSFSETFNIVAADSIACGVPTVMSQEIPWARHGFARPTDVDDMARALRSVWKYRKLNVFLNQTGLSAYARSSYKVWNKAALWQ